MRACAWPPCTNEVPRRNAAYCGKRCSARGNAKERLARRGVATRTETRDGIMAALGPGPLAEDDLLRRVYGADDADARYALRRVVERGSDFFTRQGCHVRVRETRTYELVRGYRLREGG